MRYADISPNAKLLFGEITALCNKEGFCWASNSYFAKIYKVKNCTVSEWIRQLKEFGFIDYSIKDYNQRKITLREKPIGVSEKTDRGVSEKTEHSNTEDNNTINKSHALESAKEGELIDLFKLVNPSYKILFQRKNQHEAIRRMEKEHGVEKLTAMISFLPKNNLQPYAPKITTPIQLEENMGKIVAFWQQEKSKKQTKGIKTNL